MNEKSSKTFWVLKDKGENSVEPLYAILPDGKTDHLVVFISELAVMNFCESRNMENCTAVAYGPEEIAQLFPDFPNVQIYDEAESAIWEGQLSQLEEAPDETSSE